MSTLKTFNSEDRMVKLYDKAFMEVVARNTSDCPSEYIRMTDSFICDINVNGKQFKRYKQKVEDQIIEFFTKNIIVPKRQPTFKDVLIFYTANALIADSADNPYIKKGMITKYKLLPLTCFDTNVFCLNAVTDVGEDEDVLLSLNLLSIVMKFFLGKFPDKQDENCFEADEFISLSFEKNLLKFLTLKSATNAKIDKETYIIQTTPLSVEDMFRIIIDIVNDIISKVCSLLEDEDNDRSLKKEKKYKYLTRELKKSREAVKGLKKENKAVVEQLQSEIKSKDAEIARLNAEYSQNKSEEAFEELAESNKTIRRQNSKLKKNYNLLLEKYNALAASLGESALTETTVEEAEFREVDVNGRYVFVADDNRTNFATKVKETFPNAVLINNAINLNPNSTDIVIFMTGIISHSIYAAIKAQCKSKNIQYIHCASQNMEVVKQVIESSINSI